MPEKVIPTVKETVGSVSYTHLDVYKRQVFAPMIHDWQEVLYWVTIASITIANKMCIRDRCIRVPLRSAGAYPAVSSIASINYQVLDIKLRNKSLRINT